MKKHNEGYVLPFVLVVLVVVCIVALSLMSAALSNLQRQQASIERMEAKYAAQGEIEWVVGNLADKINETYTGQFPEETTEDNRTKAAAATLILKSICGDWEYSEEKTSFSTTQTITSSDGSIVAKINVSVVVDSVVLPEPKGEEAPTETYDFKVVISGSVEFDSYTISHEGGGPQ